MLPGKKYTPEDFLAIARKRWWILVIPAVISGVGAFVWSSSLPNRYRSQTTIQIVPQQVPQAFVRPTVTTDISERLQTISQQIMSRTNLEAVIQEFNLYPTERRTKILEDVIEQMRRDISVNIAASRRDGESSSFTVEYVSSEPRTAMQVAEKLASLFVQENLQDRGMLADSTSTFLQTQLEDARRRLIEHEQRLAEFRQKHAGRLPSQMQSNLQLMQTTQAQLQANSEAATRERDRLAILEMSIAETAATAVQTAPAAAETDQPGTGTAVQQLESAKAQLRNMELRLKPQHPDIIRAKRVIAELEQKAELELELQPLQEERVPPVVVTGPPTPTQTRLQAMRLEAEEIRRRLDARKQQEERLQQLIASFTTRVEAAPALESELTELMRDYTNLQDMYTSLGRKNEDAKMAANLERRQIGEQFKIIDGARLPERPFSPDRQRLNLLGVAAGLGFGFAIVALLEYRDTTFKSDHDIVASLALPVIAIVPAMLSTGEVRRMKKRRRLLVLSASVASALVLAVVVAWQLRLLDRWID